MMEKTVKVCRACLAMDVKLFPLQGHLENDLKTVVGDNIVLFASLPGYACFECAVLLRKFSKFKEKCLTAQSILCNLLQISLQISKYEIKSICRSALNLASNLSITTVLSEDYFPDNVRVKVEPDLEMTVDEVKSERRGNVSDGYDEDDELPLKFVSNKNKKSKHNIIHKNARLKAKKMKTTEVNNKPNKTNKLKYDIVDLSKHFDITKLTIEEQIAEVMKRKESANYRDSPHKCDKCYKGFLLEETLRNHMARHDVSAGSGCEPCAVCGAAPRSLRAARAHAARHASRYTCRRCAFRTPHVDQAKKHKAWHDGVTYKCQYCDEESTKLTSHLSHMRVKHPSEYVCEICGYSFVSEKGVKMHKSRMHSNIKEESKSKTEECQNENSQGSSLYCDVCDVKFASVEAWKRHLVTSARHRDSLGTGCRQCGETFASSAALKAHRRVHEPEQRRAARTSVQRRRYRPAPARHYPARCEHCEEMIQNRSRHWKHYQRSHQDKEYPMSERNYMCEICGKGFQSNAFLVYHRRRHSPQQQQQQQQQRSSAPAAAVASACAVCGRSFASRATLLQHAKTHTDTRFPCQYCGRTFSRAASVSLHVTRVHARTTFVQNET